LGSYHIQPESSGTARGQTHHRDFFMGAQLVAPRKNKTASNRPRVISYILDFPSLPKAKGENRKNC